MLHRNEDTKRKTEGTVRSRKISTRSAKQQPRECRDTMVKAAELMRGIVKCWWMEEVKKAIEEKWEA